MPILKIAKHKALQKGKVYNYIFTYGKSVHSAEIPYVFNHKNLTNDDKIISNIMTDYWISFAKTGKPSSKEYTNWDEFSNDEATMIIDVKPYVTHHHDRELMKLLAPNYKF